MPTTIRPATRDDVPFLADVVMRAARSHVEKGLWDIAIPDSATAERDRLRCIEGVLATDQVSWCHYSNFIVAEVEGECAAALSAFAAPGSSTFPVSARRYKEART